MYLLGSRIFSACPCLTGLNANCWIEYLGSSTTASAHFFSVWSSVTSVLIYHLPVKWGSPPMQGIHFPPPPYVSILLPLCAVSNVIFNHVNIIALELCFSRIPCSWWFQVRAGHREIHMTFGWEKLGSSHGFRRVCLGTRVLLHLMHIIADLVAHFLGGGSSHTLCSFISFQIPHSPSPSPRVGTWELQGWAHWLLLQATHIAQAHTETVQGCSPSPPHGFQIAHFPFTFSLSWIHSTNISKS